MTRAEIVHRLGSDIDVMIDVDEGPPGRKPLFSAFDIGGSGVDARRPRQ